MDEWYPKSPHVLCLLFFSKVIEKKEKKKKNDSCFDDHNVCVCAREVHPSYTFSFFGAVWGIYELVGFSLPCGVPVFFF